MSNRLNRFEWLKAVMQARDMMPMAKVVASALAIQFANDATGQISPSAATLAKYVGSSLPTINRAVRALEVAGWLARTEGRGRGKFTQFTLLSPGKVIAFAAQKKAIISDVSNMENRSSVETKAIISDPPPCTPYNDKQSSEQRAREPAKRPISLNHSKMIERGSPNEVAWNAWLDSRNFPTLAQLGLRHGTGWDAPFRYPPSVIDKLETSMAEKWANWAVFRMDERGRSYA